METETNIFWSVVVIFVLAAYWLATHPQVLHQIARMMDGGVR